MFKIDFDITSDYIVIGDPMPGEGNKDRTYIELDNPHKGLWGCIPVFDGGYLESLAVLSRERSRVNYKVDEEYTIDTPSGYIGVFDGDYFKNDGSDEEYEDIIIELCNNKEKCSGCTECGAVARPSFDRDIKTPVLVSRNYDGEIVEIIIDFI